MLKFFRTIRQKLLSTGQTSKYFKYAIGEILLVVIGILIALQINNMNEARKTKNAELKVLEQMRLDIRRDSIAFQVSLGAQKNVENLHLDIYNQIRSPQDDLKRLSVDSLRRGIFYNSVFLQRHKQNTLLITNDHLRPDMGNFINKLENAEQAKNHYDEYLDQHLKPYFSKHGIHRLDANFDQKGHSPAPRTNYVDYNKLRVLFGTNAFEEKLFELSLRNSWFISQLNEAIQANEQVKQQILTEIEESK